GNPRNASNQNTTCLFGRSVQTGPGFNYPASGCAVTGDSYTDYSDGTAAPGYSANTTCLTDSQLRAEVSSIVEHMGVGPRTQPGYSPIIDLLLPPRVETCLDTAGTLCSVNASAQSAPTSPDVATTSTGGTLAAGTYEVEVTYQTASGETEPSAPKTVTTTANTSTITVSSPAAMPGASGWYAYITEPDGSVLARQQPSPTAIGSSFTLKAPPSTGNPLPARFCSYHSQVTVGGRVFAYVVQPWTAMTQCDDPLAPQIPQAPPPDELAKDVGIRLVSPLSQSQIASIINPQFNGWFAQDGSEINDGCLPQSGLDNVTVGSGTYLLQPEFNNAALMESDPFTYFGCAPNVILSPSFVVPSSIDQGEAVGFDGSTTASTLIVPNGQYQWNFGDGSKLSFGASVVHRFAKAGYYHVTLTVTDRGWNTRSVTQTVEVLQSNGQPPSSGGHHHGPPAFKVHLELLPQSLKQVLSSGLQVRVSSNEAADGFATLLIPQSVAKKANISGHRTSSGVVVGRGTVSGIKAGSVSLRVRVSSSTASRLAHVGYLSLTLRLALAGQSGGHVTVQATGRY
ncbi:MAG TPA: PKD domain-containing protein, partial [Solirubrobacteraceae bacterium]|nr:PKD domain-containing protein [Solirubrobacteraceae bacterium]